MTSPSERQLVVIGISFLHGSAFAMGLTLMFSGGIWQQPVGTALVAMSITSALAIQVMLIQFCWPPAGVQCPSCHNEVYSTGNSRKHALMRGGGRECEGVQH